MPLGWSQSVLVLCGHCLVLHRLQHCHEHHSPHRERHQTRSRNGRGLCRWFPGFNHCFANDAVTHYQLQLANGSCWVLGLGLCHAASGLLGSKADKIEIESVVGKPQSATEAITEALGHKGYRVLAIAFFVCGLQLVLSPPTCPPILTSAAWTPRWAATHWP